MPVIFYYLIKLAICTAAVFLFYQLVLRRLTFYNWNRWYLLLYSMLVFFIPFVNVESLLQQHDFMQTSVVRYIPAVGQLAPTSAPNVTTSTLHYTGWDVLMVLLSLGALVLFLRLVIQYVSFLKIRRKARLLYQDDVTVYQVDKDIIPFSFGNAIFINKQLHTEAELKEIIRHEFVHVQQKHTIDVVWSEVFCLLNWYNPFAWMLRHAIRQNLEFIADQQVLQSGFNKKDYQYLLLKVMGSSGFRIASQFNFSSLKKRIIMMNKLKSSKVHLLKFLFVLPLAAVLLVAFRNAGPGNNGTMPLVTVTGLVVEGSSYTPLKGVRVIEKYSNQETITDDKGYYSIALPNDAFPVQTDVTFKKDGYTAVTSGATLTTKSNTALALIDIVNLEPLGQNGTIKGYGTSSSIVTIENGKVPTYDDLSSMLASYVKSWQTETELKNLSANSTKPYWVVNGSTYIITNGGSWAGVDEVTDIVYVNGTRTTGEAVNRTVSRSSITKVSATSGETAQQKFGINKGVLEIWLQNATTDTIPPPPPPVPVDDYDDFMKRNPTVKNLHWKGDSVYIAHKNGRVEGFLLNKKGKETINNKYGKLPIPPPPPPVPMHPPKPPAGTAHSSLRTDGMNA